MHRALLAMVGVFALLALGVVAAATTGSGDTAPATDHADPGKVGYASLTGPIDRLRNRYLARVVERARALELDTLVLHIDTDGGEVGQAREMFKQVVDQATDGPRMIAFVDFRAISAGAMIAYAHEQIWMSRAASIGDIGVIFLSREGEIKYAPEKIETVVRSHLVQAAEVRGWDRALLLKMTARTQKLYRITRADGEVLHVIEDDLPEFLANNPDIDPEDTSQMYVYRGEDRLLTLTGTEAVELGMATGQAETIDDVWAALGVEPDTVTNLTPKLAERTAWLLAPAAPLLAGLALLFIMFELKTPGVGLFALLAAVCAGGFVIAQFYLDMAENIELLLVLIGLALLAVDALLGLGGGLLALGGGGLALTGLVLSFVPNELDFDLTDPAVVDALVNAAGSTLVSVVVLGVGLAFAARLAPGSRLAGRVALQAEIAATNTGDTDAHNATLVGRSGVARDALRPNGIVLIDGVSHGARATNGAYLDAGTPVLVAGIEFGELLVTRNEESTDGQ